MRQVPFVTVAVLSCFFASVSSSAQSTVVEDTNRAPVAKQQNKPVMDLDVDFASITPTGPGCEVGVRIAGGAPLIRSYGLADLEHPMPITAATVFETGSLAKQFTASAILLLVQNGKLALDDNIRRYLPEMPDYETPITIRHLLTHTSGLREQWSLMALAGNPPGTQVHTQSMILDLASRQKGLNFAPGAEFLYTNTNFVLAAIIVERVSGKSLQRFTDERLFQPLGMTHSRWREDYRTVVPGRATAYASAGDGFIGAMPFTNVYGNGGLLTTIDDLLRWNAFLDHPWEFPGGEALVTALQTPGKLNNGKAIEYALGLEVTRTHGLRLIAHSGSTGGYKTWLGRYPDKDISVAMLCNNGDVDPVKLGEKVAEQALHATGYTEKELAGSVSGPSPLIAPALSVDLTPYQGLFRNPVTGDLIETKIVDHQLTLHRGSTQVLLLIGGARFQRADGGVVQFLMSNGKGMELMLGDDASSQRYVAVAPFKIGNDTFAAYVGTYYSAELDKRISVVRKGDTLVMQQPFAIEWPLAPTFADAFTTRLRGTTTFVFARTPNGHISGFAAWATGARNIQFVRESR